MGGRVICIRKEHAHEKLCHQWHRQPRLDPGDGSIVTPTGANGPCPIRLCATTIRGKIVSLKGSELVVASPSGDAKLALSEKIVIRAEIAIVFSEITPGMYLGTTATKQADGNFWHPRSMFSPKISAAPARGIGR